MSSTKSIIRAAIVVSAFVIVAPAYAATSIPDQKSHATGLREGLDDLKMARNGADDGAHHQRRDKGRDDGRNHASLPGANILMLARQGADDGAGHVRHGGDGDDAQGDNHGGRGSDDAGHGNHGGDDRGHRG